MGQIKTINNNEKKYDNREETLKFVDEVNWNNILSRYKSVFDKELETLKNVAIPIFCRARPIPYVLKDRLEKELERLVTEGILEPIYHCERAAPIVPVTKPRSSVRVCGDYKQTVNKASNCDKYPVPSTEDSFTLLGGGENFPKLYLSHGGGRGTSIPTIEISAQFIESFNSL